MILTFCNKCDIVCKIAVSKGVTGVRLYDENGICIGSVRKNDLRNSEESIMPVSITVTPVKHFILPNGYILMAVAAGAAVLSMVLSILTEIFDFPDEIVSFLGTLGLCGTESYLFVPLTALIQLAALFVMAKYHFAFFYAVGMYSYIIASGLFYEIMRPESWDNRNFMYIADIIIIITFFALCYIGYEKIHITFLRIPYVWMILPVRLLAEIILFVFAPDSVAGWLIGIMYYLFEIVYWCRIDAFTQKETA